MTAANTGANRLSQAVSLLQSGRTEDALRQLTSLASVEPRNADVFGWLAIAQVRTGKLQEAQRAIQRSIDINPANAGFYLTAANIQQDLGNLPVAADLLRQAIRVHPGFAEGHNNLGIVLTDLQRNDEAIAAYREAIRLKPGYARAYANLAAVQLRSLQFQDALASAQRAVQLQPGYAHAHHLAGNVLAMIGDSTAAAIALQSALRLKPDFVESSLLLAKVLTKLKRHDESDQVVQQALARSPGRHELWAMLGDAHAARDDLPAALAAYRRALELRPADLSSTAKAALLLPSVYTDETHLDQCRNRLSQGIAQLNADAHLLAEKLQPERFGDAIPNSFLLAYQGRDDRELQCSYADFVYKVAEIAIPQELQALPRSAPQGRRIRIGFCSRFFHRSTAGVYFASWIADLDPDVFEVFLYHTHVAEDDLTRQLREAAAHFVQAEESFAFFRTRIRRDTLDILVYPELGMDRIVYLLAALRLAPIQVCGWGHPVTPGHRNIDYYLSCVAMEPADAQAHYNEKLLLLPGIGTRYEMPQLPAGVVAKTRADYQLPQDSTLYFFPQSLFKVHPANDRLLVQAMANDARGVLVMFAGQNQEITRRFVSRLSAAFAEQGLSAQGRVKILPGVAHDDYKRINQLCDLMLDTLHWSGGNTSLDALAMGLPIVTLPGEFMRGRQTMAMLRLLGIDELIAQSTDDYLSIANKLATDKAYRQHISARILAGHSRLFDDAEPTRVLAGILEQLARA